MRKEKVSFIDLEVMRQIIGNRIILLISLLILSACNIFSAEEDRETPFLKELKKNFPKSDFGINDEGMYWVSFWGNRGDSLEEWYSIFRNKEDSISSFTFIYYENISQDLIHLKKFKKLSKLQIIESKLDEIPLSSLILIS
ncbi:hypothetical protein [Flammeovirga kamogawensis]|uniref:hypothetical protein n=1 Tax=Flammeovirga kamogawensis TaxID=373891 RepID=UPI001181EF9A|nr:hypothetical protein [Flammeovirga kamogawensis]TRX66723.1 hypothetical protein EO216_00745 [Flammeovirga kamogawensis]